MKLYELYPFVCHSNDTFIIHSVGKPFPKCAYNFDDNGYTCRIFTDNNRAFTWADFMNRVDTAFRLVGKSEIVAIDGNTITINIK